MVSDKRDLLFEIGCEELPASFVEGALAALPGLCEKQLGSLRLTYDGVQSLGTPRRLAVLIRGLATTQPDLEEKVTGPPVKAAFRDGKPTRAAEAFASKLGCGLADLERVMLPKGEYLCGMRRERGRPAAELLPEALATIAKAIPFRKSMRWGSGDLAFGRPLRWLLALYGQQVLKLGLGLIESGAVSFGHRFLHPGEVKIQAPSSYVEAMREARVFVDPNERAALMKQRLSDGAAAAGGQLIEDAFLVAENVSLVEDPQVIVGAFDPVFLELPEEVILEVARGHQRYFGLRGAAGKLLAKYLAVVNTAEAPDTIVAGNDRVMRARLADARFFYAEDLKRPFVARRQELEAVVFQKRLGSMLAKATRIEQLSAALGEQLGQPEAICTAASRGAHLCKCDLVTLMVGEFPELQGAVGSAYALAQGEPAEVACVVREHVQPRGAADTPAPTAAGAIVALADRLDSLVGCFSIGQVPTGAADPYGLRRACIGSLRTMLAHDFDLRISEALAAARAGYERAEVALDLDEASLVERLGSFFRDRLRGLLADGLPTDVIDAALGVAADRPVDARARARAIVQLAPEIRARVGEVFKRASNIAKTAPDGAPELGSEPAERALFEAFFAIKDKLEQAASAGDYGAAFEQVAELAPSLGQFFDDVLVMAEDEAVRANRLRLMRAISETCSSLARLELLAPSSSLLASS